MSTLSVPHIEQFIALANALSPENLHMDGEFSRAQARRLEAAIRARWRALEIHVGRSVSEDEVWAAVFYRHGNQGTHNTRGNR